MLSIAYHARVTLNISAVNSVGGGKLVFCVQMELLLSDVHEFPILYVIVSSGVLYKLLWCSETYILMMGIVPSLTWSPLITFLSCQWYG